MLFKLIDLSGVSDDLSTRPKKVRPRQQQMAAQEDRNGLSRNKGDVLVGNANGTYDVVATSTLGIIPTWGSIKGTLSSQTDLLSALNSLVPYSGATGNVDLGSHNFNAQNIKVNGGTGHGNSLEVNGTAEANYFNALSFGQVIDNNANAHFHTLNLNSATAGTVAGVYLRYIYSGVEVIL